MRTMGVQNVLFKGIISHFELAFLVCYGFDFLYQSLNPNFSFGITLLDWKNISFYLAS